MFLCHVGRQRLLAEVPVASAAFQAPGTEEKPPGSSTATGSSTNEATAVSTANWFVFRTVFSFRGLKLTLKQNNRDISLYHCI